MITGIFVFIISWTSFLLFADKRKFRQYIFTGYVGIILALITDLMMFVYPLWKYPGIKEELFFTQMLNGFGLYLVIIYFFLQLLPKKQTISSMIRYIFYWSIFVITLESLFLYINFIEYGLWWNIIYSYLADWILFIIFYFHHRWVSHQ